MCDYFEYLMLQNVFKHKMLSGGRGAKLKEILYEAQNSTLYGDRGVNLNIYFFQQLTFLNLIDGRDSNAYHKKIRIFKIRNLKTLS